jgi:hypothetical protein
LAHDWKHIGTLGKLGASDKKFENFVLRHIDETLPTDMLKAIANTRSGPSAVRSSRPASVRRGKKITRSLRILWYLRFPI